MDFIERIFTDFSEIHGDRAFGDDAAVACGMARLAGEEVMVIGNRKGGTTKERVRRNFGMPHPEGYRKALRCMKIAEKFERPIISFIAHTDHPVGAGLVGSAIKKHLDQLRGIPVEKLVAARQEKFRNIAQCYTES